MFGLNLSDTKGKIVVGVVIAALVGFGLVVVFSKHLKTGPTQPQPNNAAEFQKDSH